MHEISVVHLKDRGVRNITRIDRGTLLGNPFVVSRDGSRLEVISKYEGWLRDEMTKDGPVKEKLRTLLNKAKRGALNLGCWCAPMPCHGDVIRKILMEMDENNEH